MTNSPDVDWSTLSAHFHRSILLCVIIYHLNLIQLISFPTHIQGNTLDLLFTIIGEHIHNISTTTSSTLQSDHLIILFDNNCSIRPHKKNYQIHLQP